ncbi:arylsulfotransferase family protein [Geodermatophilus marinus]|uniref:arylsulfotransferase family protein n=1 Tax=Geodermatophilus sp. LHW52908 TaxID=2303986 RepID=UPI0013150158|nr:arylsulfotransferase family protein [Geodermatophilus sp. LHW52908]
MHVLSRRRAPLLVAAGLLLLPACSTSEAADEEASEPGPHWTFVSRPDLTPPKVTVTGTPRAEDGTVLALGPKGDDAPHTGPLLVDAAGEPLWVHPTEGSAFDVRIQEYQGEPVLTWWEGEQEIGVGWGEFHIVDTSYEEVATVTTGGDVGSGQADFHEGRLTPEGTMLIPAYVAEPADLTSVGGPEDGWVYDNLIQEVDVATGEVVFEWSARDHVPLEETASEFEEGEGTEEDPFDWFHVNSMSVDADGSLLVSARNTWAVYDLDRTTGEVLWTLGGEGSDFAMGPGTEFAWQHDAERQPDGTLTLFDNQSEPDVGPVSRGLRLALDETARTATLVTEYLPPDDDRLAGSQGSFQQLPDGTVVVGWGSRSFWSEFAPDGTLRYDAALGSGDNYRADRAPWTGRPTTDPDAVRDGDTVFASWNGATEVAAWRLVADGVEADPVPRDGFETELPVPEGADELRVEALDDAGEVIGAAEVG